ncbi:MAG: 2-amino-4-hydroxy-6-hydroxymethyldihydropteridine diphosphokinase [Mangrovibacterium sp.]
MNVIPMNTCIIGIGSNMDPEVNMARLLDILKKETSLLKVSSLVTTKPIGITDQPDFVNGAAKLETEFSMDEFRQYLKKLEDRLGRDRSQPKFGPRTIDLDIVVWNGQIIDEDYHTRDFLRAAVAELGFASSD